MAYTTSISVNPVTIALRDATLPYDQIAPGRYPDEYTVLIDSTLLVAASAQPKWLENGAGVEITVIMRCINSDGSTKTTAAGQHIETSYTASYSMEYIEAASNPGATDTSSGIFNIAVSTAYLMMNMNPAVIGTMSFNGTSQPYVRLSQDILQRVNIVRQAELALGTSSLSLDGSMDVLTILNDETGTIMTAEDGAVLRV
jgi:hypothetical protein